MTRAIIKLFVTPLVILLAAQLMSGIYAPGYWPALVVSFWILLVGFFIGWLINFLLNLLTLGIFWAVGLGFLTWTIAYTFVIWLVDHFTDDFHTEGFWNRFGLALLLGLAWTLLDRIGRSPKRY